MKVSVLERDGKEFYYLNFGCERQGCPSFRLWINRKLVDRDGDGNPIVERLFGKDRRIIRTEKGNYVLRREEGYSTFEIGWESGYRGWSDYKILSPQAVELELPYENWRSPRGSLGVSKYALVVVKGDRLLVRLTRGGRLYGEPAERLYEYYCDEGGYQRERELPDACMDEELAELTEG